MHAKSLLRSPALGYVVAYCLALTIGFYFRLYPLREFTKAESKDRASVVVLHQIKQQLAARVKEANPGLEGTAQQLLARKLFEEYLKKNGAAVRQEIEAASRKLDPFLKEGRTTPYLLASDGFYYYSLTLNILENGKMASRVSGAKYFNNMMLAPVGFWEPFNGHPYVGYLVYRCLDIFRPGIDLMYAISFTPLVVTTLCLLVFLVLCGSLGISPTLSFISAVFLLLAPIFVKRSMFAWYDNDPYTVLFPLMTLLFLFKTFNAAGGFRQRLFPALMTVLSLGLYAYFWHGWVFLLCIVVGSLGVILLYHLLISRDGQASRLYASFLGSLIAGIFVLVSLLFGPSQLFVLLSEGFGALRDFLSPQLSAWPDLYISVSELHPAEMAFVIEQTGGLLFFVVALIGFAHELLAKKDKSIGITLACYGLISFFIALGAQRFAILPLVPFAVAFGLGLKAIYDYLSAWVASATARPASAALVRMGPALILCLTIALPISWMNRSLPTLLNPIFNQTWEKALVKIREETPRKSIVNTWWPPGHFIKAIARRSVTFDGATISVPQAYWLANFFLKEDEMEALAILRMLNTGGNRAVEAMLAKGLDLPTAVLAVRDLLSRTQDQAYKIVLRTFKDFGFAKQMLRLTHGKPRPSYILVYNEFVENNLQLKFIAHHNFKEIQNINQDPARLSKLPSHRSPEFIQLLWKLAGGAHRYSGVLPYIGQTDAVLLFGENVTVDKKTLLTQVDSAKYGKGIPGSIFFIKDGQVLEKRLPGASLSYSALLFFRGETPGLILLDRSLARSMLMRLYFFEGAGLKFIKPFTHERDLSGRTDIYVFEVDWDGYREALKESSSMPGAEDCVEADEFGPPR